MKQSFVVMKNGLPSHTAHMAFNDSIKPGDVDENGCVYIEIPEGVSDTCVLSEYIMNQNTGELVHLGPCPGDYYKRDIASLAWIYDIEAAKLEKAKKISAACRDAITAGYESSALGSLLHYPCAEKDQINMMGSVTDSLNPLNDTDWVTPFWCADSDGNWEYRMHTKGQIQKAGADGKAHIVSQITKNAQLQSALRVASTQEEVDAVSW